MYIKCGKLLVVRFNKFEETSMTLIYVKIFYFLYNEKKKLRFLKYPNYKDNFEWWKIETRKIKK